MAYDKRDVDGKLDDVLLCCLPTEGEVLEASPLGLSNWCETTRYDVRLPDESIARFFEKRATGTAGFERMQGHWHSETGLYQFIPEFVPRPVAFGTYASDPDVHFILLEFEDMIDDEFPAPDMYCAPPVALHLRSVGKSPTGKFGFPVNTQFGTLALQNEWEDSWEVWFTKHMTRLLTLEEEIRGPFNESDAKLKEAFLNKVLPRYLRPLESEGRSIQPTLCHTDLWPGNVKYKPDNESILVYDANALWAHNEIELGMFRNPRQPFGKPYTDEYWKHVRISKPEDEAENRIIIYLIRFHVMVASTWNPTDRQLFLDNMKTLVDRVAEEEKLKA